MDRRVNAVGVPLDPPINAPTTAELIGQQLAEERAAHEKTRRRLAAALRKLRKKEAKE